MMDGIEFQLRSPQGEALSREDILQSRLTYPLPMDKKLAQGDTFRISKEKLVLQLNEIESFYVSAEAQSHAGPPNCPRCTEKKAKIAHAFAEYYLSIEPGTWSMDFPGIRQKLRTTLDDPNVSLRDVHVLFQTGLREHLKKDLCTPHPTDVTSTTSLKSLTTAMFDDDTPMSTILTFYLSELGSRAPNPEAAKLMTLLQSTKTAEDRARIYIDYYCPLVPSDSIIRRNFKQKYARMFEMLVPHDDVLSAMKEEADESMKIKVNGFKGQLSELQMAQNAHLKDKQKKLDRDRGQQNVREQVVGCVLEGCMNDVNLMTDEIIECAICEWLAGKGGQNGERRVRAVYCSVEHAQADFETHDQLAHSCIMGDRCVNYPAAGPSTSSSSGLCSNCLSHGFISYFCSSDCHNHNYELHRDDFMQRDIGIHNDDDAMEMFRPATDFEILEFEEDEERGRAREQHYDEEELEEGERMDDA